LTVIVLQQTAESRLTLACPFTLIGNVARGKRHDIADSLVRTFCVIMRRVMVQRMPQRPFTTQYQLREHRRFHCSHPALGERTQMRRSRWPGDSFDARIIDNVLEGRTIFAVAIMDEIGSRLQAPQVSIVA
jgi:hypothetical protein